MDRKRLRKKEERNDSTYSTITQYTQRAYLKLNPVWVVFVVMRIEAISFVLPRWNHMIP